MNEYIETNKVPKNMIVIFNMFEKSQTVDSVTLTDYLKKNKIYYSFKTVL